MRRRKIALAVLSVAAIVAVMVISITSCSTPAATEPTEVEPAVTYEQAREACPHGLASFQPSTGAFECATPAEPESADAEIVALEEKIEELTTAIAEMEKNEPEEVYVQGGVNQTQDGSVELFVLNPSAPTKEQKRHPAIYQETRVSGTPVDFIIDVPEDYVTIVGGWEVDGTDNGVYVAHGPGHYEHTVVDGFVLIIQRSWAQAEWDFRLSEANKYDWAHNTVNPGPLD